MSQGEFSSPVFYNIAMDVLLVVNLNILIRIVLLVRNLGQVKLELVVLIRESRNVMHLGIRRHINRNWITIFIQYVLAIGALYVNRAAVRILEGNWLAAIHQILIIAIIILCIHDAAIYICLDIYNTICTLITIAIFVLHKCDIAIALLVIVSHGSQLIR